jgi:hypothetical protein
MSPHRAVDATSYMKLVVDSLACATDLRVTDVGLPGVIRQLAEIMHGRGARAAGAFVLDAYRTCSVRAPVSRCEHGHAVNRFD